MVTMSRDDQNLLYGMGYGIKFKIKTVFRQREANEAIGDSMKNMSVRNGFEINFESPHIIWPIYYIDHIIVYII